MQNSWLTHSYHPGHIAWSEFDYSIFHEGGALSEKKDRDVTLPSECA